MPEPFELSRLADLDPEIHGLLEECPDIEARRYRDGEYLMREGEESQDLFVVLQGAYVVERPAPAPGAPALILATVEADPGNPSVVGEMAYFGTQVRSASVRSVGATFTLCLFPRHIDRIVEGLPRLLKIIFRQYAFRLSEANRSLKELQSRFAMDPQRRMAASGERLFEAGEPANQIFQLVIGSIQLEAPGDPGQGAEIVGPNDLPGGFLELGPYLRGQAHTRTAVVLESAFLVAVDGAHREALVRSYPDLALAALM